MYFYRQVNRNQAETKHFMLLLRVYAYSLFVITLPSLSQIFISLLIGAEFKQKTGSYIVWAVFHGFLANFQVLLPSVYEILTGFIHKKY